MSPAFDLSSVSARRMAHNMTLGDALNSVLLYPSTNNTALLSLISVITLMVRIRTNTSYQYCYTNAPCQYRAITLTLRTSAITLTLLPVPLH